MSVSCSSLNLCTFKKILLFTSLMKFIQNTCIIATSSSNTSNRNMILGSTQTLIEMSTRKIPRGRGQPTRKADNLTAICEPIV
jgi:hypothetical protein